MAKSTKPRKKKSASLSAREMKSIENVKLLLKDTLIGSVQIKENAQITIRNGKLLDKPTQGMSSAFQNIKFPYKFMIGYIGRKENGVPYCVYEFVTLSNHSKLYNKELDDLIFNDLRSKFKHSNHNTRLTTFWIASPNPEVIDDKFFTTFFLLMDKYRVFDNMITQYDIHHNIERGRSLHATNYWYSLCEFEEITYEEKENTSESS